MSQSGPESETGFDHIQAKVIEGIPSCLCRGTHDEWHTVVSNPDVTEA